MSKDNLPGQLTIADYLAEKKSSVFLPVENVSAGIACTGGAVGVLTEIAMTIIEQKQILTTRHIQANRHEQRGATGINQESRHIGVEVGCYTR